MTFVRKNGRPLSEINPGSSEFALGVDDSLHALSLIEVAKSAVLGGDILSDESGKLSYTYENWYCQRMVSESEIDYRLRSYQVAREYISKVASRSGKNRYVVLVI